MNRTPKRLLLLALFATVLAASLILGDARQAPAAHDPDTIVALTAGGSHTCLVTSAGDVRCWGWGGEEILGRELLHRFAKDVPGNVEGFQGIATRITTGNSHTCALLDDSTASCWGSLRDTLGAGPTDTYAPQEVIGIDAEITSISAGVLHSCAATADQRLWCWGASGEGNLGFDCGSQWCTTPMEATAVSGDVVSVDSGFMYTCVVTTAATVRCWGHNYAGNLGNGTQTHSSTPVDVIIDEDVASVDAYLQTCAVTVSGALKCWGANDKGQSGTGVTGDVEPIITTPTDVVGLTEGVAAVSTGAHHTCALTTQGAVKCWGSNEILQLGSGYWSPDTAIPTDVIGLDEGVTMIAAGDDHTCALVYNEVMCWGAGYGPEPVPLPIDDDHDFVPDRFDNCLGLANPQQLDNDLDGLGDECDEDNDGDGCNDAYELGDDPTKGGMRDPLDPWDYYDVSGPGGGPPDGVIDLPNDILGVIQHLRDYDVRFDRGPSTGPNPWNMTAPDGVIDLPNDLLGVIYQFGHNCT